MLVITKNQAQERKRRDRVYDQSFSAGDSGLFFDLNIRSSFVTVRVPRANPEKAVDFA